MWIWDVRGLKELGSLERVAEAYQREALPESFNKEKVSRLFDRDPERDRLLQLARGIKVDLRNDFQVNNLPTEFRKLEKQLKNTYRESYFKLWKKK